MRLCFFRASSEISVKDMEKVAERISHVFGVDYFIFTGPINGRVEIVTMELLLKISNQFLDRGEPIVAIVFTKESVDDMDIWGEASQLDRGAWVRWSDDLQRVTITALHELGHLCDAEHCINESCIMFHTYREHNGVSMNDIFCEKCRITVQNSWVYNRLLQATEDRARKGQRPPRIVQSSSPLASSILAKIRQPKRVFLPPTPVSRALPDSYAPPFPTWPPAKKDEEEFVRQVMEHFGYRRR